MADTERTLAALQALLADNTTQQISAQDLRDFLVTALGGYASMHFDGTPAAQGSLDATPVKLTCFDGIGVELGASADHATDTITAGSAGLYLVAFACGFSGETSTTYELALGVNGVADTTISTKRQISTINDIGAASFVGIVSCSSGDALTVMASVASGPKSITVERASFTVKRVG